MSTVTEKQIANYLSYGGTDLKDNERFQEATRLKEQAEKEDRFSGHYYRSQAHVLMNKSRELFVSLGSEYFQEAKRAEDPQARAFFFGRARSIFEKNHGYDEHMLALRDEALYEEALACSDTAKKVTDCSKKAEWLLRATYLLNPALENKLLLSERFKPIERHALTAQCWEQLGDLFLQYKKQVSIPITRRHYFPFPDRPKCAAATCFKQAIDATHNENTVAQFKSKNYERNSLDDKKTELCDKAITALESTGLKINEILFSAYFYEMLAGFYEIKRWDSSELIVSKETNCFQIIIKAGKERIADSLDKKLLQLWKESASFFNRALEEKPSQSWLYRNVAQSLYQAAHHAKGEEADLLLQQASDAATDFFIKNSISPEYWYGNAKEELLAVRRIQNKQMKIGYYKN